MLVKSITLALFLATIGTCAVAAPSAVGPAPQVRITLTLHNHRFIPDVVSVPAGAPLVVTLVNQDVTGEEFDSDDLRIEEDVTPKARITFRIGPLKPGSYQFIGEGHPETAQGRLVAFPPVG